MSRKAEVEAAIADVDFDNNNYQVHLDTSHGLIVLDMNPEAAPEHCKNIMGLAKIGFYDGLIFHRVISGFMIQGGCPQGSGTGGPGYNVDAEFNSTPHLAGTLSMARSSDPNSAGSQFFICLGTQDFLDGQYTVFGQATPESMSVVEAIGGVSTNGSDRPDEDVTIKSATVIQA